MDLDKKEEIILNEADKRLMDSFEYVMNSPFYKYLDVVGALNRFIEKSNDFLGKDNQEKYYRGVLSATVGGYSTYNLEELWRQRNPFERDMCIKMRYYIKNTLKDELENV